ncbi:acyl-CoA dehydrogenase family protein [Paraburkholderia sediminicola]|uniref:acyl-CoA dehydrogenase family protein n=1 Tax=Paraburkholderia sediminicola TaxID=458836 RepID=UPI000E71C6F3
MISFDLTEEQELARSAMRDFAQGELRPISQKLDRDSTIPQATLDALWSTGLMQLQGGGDQARCPVLNAIVLEELAVADVTLSLALATPVAFVQSILDQGSQAQRDSLLPLFAGDSFHPAALALLEPQFGSDVSKLATTSIQVADAWLLNGCKALVPLASSASHFLVVAQAGNRQEAFIVGSDLAGVSVTSPVATLGLRALELGEVTFSNVQLPESARLGESKGSDVQRIINSSRTGLAAVMTGLSRGVMDYVIPYAKDRVVHGSPLARKQSIAFRIADMYIDVAAMRLMGWRAASELSQGRDATRSAQLAYTYASRQAMSIADEGLQIFGGHGFVREHPIEMWYRNARTVSMLEGIAGV